MTEKDNVSMATVQMKTDYAASEVYSTASEPPPVSKGGGWDPVGHSIIVGGAGRAARVISMRVFVIVEWRN